MFNRNQIDLILLDVNLPDGEGFSFCRWVKGKKRSSSYVFNGQRYGGKMLWQDMIQEQRIM